MNGSLAKQRKTKKNVKGTNATSAKKTLKILILPPFAGLATLAATLLLFAYIINRAEDPEFIAKLAIPFCAFVSGGACGFSAKRITGKALPWCVLSALIFVALLTAFSALNGNLYDTDTDSFRICVFLCYLGGSCVFAMLGKKKPRRSRR